MSRTVHRPKRLTPVFLFFKISTPKYSFDASLCTRKSTSPRSHIGVDRFDKMTGLFRHMLESLLTSFTVRFVDYSAQLRR